MYLVHTRLTAQFAAEVPKDAPTSFLVDIQPDQWAEVRRRIEGAGATGLTTVPIVRARLREIDGKDVAALAASSPGDGRRRWILTREQNLTYLDRLPEGNEVVAGALWSDPGRSEISIESEFARDMGVGVGSTLRLDVQGVPIDLRVTSLRTVNWKTFGINFFLIVEPGVLEGAPQARVAAMRLPADAEQRLQDDLVAAFPNVTLLKVREILEKVVSLLDRLGLGIRLVGSFTVLAGIAILGGAVSAASERRGREVALLKTLGMTRGQVIRVFAVEYALLGAVAGAVGTAGAVVLAWAVTTRGMEIPFRLDPAACAAALVLTIALSIVAGIGASLRALSRRPLEVLRDE
jgi:putative ABC transport system permease protein